MHLRELQVAARPEDLRIPELRGTVSALGTISDAIDVVATRVLGSHLVPFRDADELVAVVDIGHVPAKGPYVLDLVFHQLSKFERIKLLARRDRTSAIASLNRQHVIAFTFFRHGEIWLGSDDVVLSELVALTLTERDPVQTPWEDDLVQAATELDLGVRYPGDIRITVAPELDGSVLIHQLHMRLGVDIS